MDELLAGNIPLGGFNSSRTWCQAQVKLIPVPGQGSLQHSFFQKAFPEQRWCQGNFCTYVI